MGKPLYAGPEGTPVKIQQPSRQRIGQRKRAYLRIAAALLALHFGDDQVTSIDVDPYLTATAAERLDSLGAHPRIVTADKARSRPVAA